jgi:hypothetical protein
MAAFFSLLALGSLAWAISGVATGQVGFIVFGAILAVIFGLVGYVNSPGSVARRDYAKPIEWITRRRLPRE